MTEQSKPKPKVEDLELNKETLQDLTEEQAKAVEGGQLAARGSLNSCNINCKTNEVGCTT
jgi:hypothetical protein